MATFPRLTRRLAMACLALLLCACSTAVRHAPVALVAAAPDAPRAILKVAAPVVVTLDTSYKRKVAEGSSWLRAGRIAQGEVFRPHQGVFTVEGAHIHEAYLVVDQTRLVGFYLPAERAFSPLSQQPFIHFNQEPQ